MRRKVVIIVIVWVVTMLLLLGAYALFDNLFPKAQPINRLEINMLESVRMCDNEDNEIVISDGQLQELISYINDAVPTRTMSVNDYPDVKPYYMIELKTTERVFRYMIYEDYGTVYAELPYEGVYEIDREAVEIFK